MSGYAHELEAARKEGVLLLTNTVPVGFEREEGGRLVGLRVARTETGQRVAGSERTLVCNLVGVAIGQSKLHAIADQLPGVDVDARGRIAVDPRTGSTGHMKVWSGGDCANGGKEVVHAVAEGRNAARDMMRYWAHGS